MSDPRDQRIFKLTNDLKEARQRARKYDYDARTANKKLALVHELILPFKDGDCSVETIRRIIAYIEQEKLR